MIPNRLYGNPFYMEWLKVGIVPACRQIANNGL